MRYFIKIEKYSGDYRLCIHQGSSLCEQAWHKVEIGPQSEIIIKGTRYPLSRLVQALIDYQVKNLEIVFDERCQLEIGQYLYAQTFAELDSIKHKHVLSNTVPVDVRIVTDDEHAALLPWVLLADRGVFLATIGWSVALSRTMNCKDCELPPSPKILVVAPQPEGVTETYATTHVEELEDLLASVDYRHSQGRHLQIVETWEDFKQAENEFQPQVVYYYGHGIGDIHTSRLVFATGKKRSRIDKPVADFANCLRQTPGGPPLLVYLNCCHGDAGGFLGAGWQLGEFVPAVLTNRTVASIQAAQAQANVFWCSVLMSGDPPHRAIAHMYSKLDDLDLSLADLRWMTPVFHCHYDQWKANPPKPASRLERDPHWSLKLDRVRQFGQVFYQTSQMLQEHKPRSLAYVWYGQEGQGVDLFHKRLKFELQEKLMDVYLYEIQPNWPMELHKPHLSFSDMLTEAFGVQSLDDIPGRIRSLNRGVFGRRTLVYVRHIPVRSSKLINLQELKIYLEWWNYNFVPLLEGETYALLSVSFVVGDPLKFRKKWKEKERIDDLRFPMTVIELLDEMEQVAKKDLLDFLYTHNINLPLSRQDRILDKVLEKTKGHYEMTLEELKDIAARAWDTQNEAIEAKKSEAEDYDYD